MNVFVFSKHGSVFENSVFLKSFLFLKRRMSDIRNKIYVGNLPNDVKEEDIDNLFGKVYCYLVFYTFSMEEFEI